MEVHTMPQMTEPRELLLHELGDILYAENVLVKALPKMAKEATDPELRKGFEKHLEETKGHVETLQQAFEALGEKAKAEQCPAIDGIKDEHDEFIREEKPGPKVRDIFLTGSGSRAEHYEIAAYTGMITIAKGLGETDCAKLLERNLKQEKAALDALTTVGKRLASES
jgi:ferritin-like metal-binding protein YciE